MDIFMEKLGMCLDRDLAGEGKRRIEWAEAQMSVLLGIRKEWEAAERKPLEGVKISACLHVTTETANLVRTFKAGGAAVALTASNPLSTQDDVAAALNEVYGITTYAVRGEDSESYYDHIRRAVSIGPDIVLDDGADLVNLLHRARKDLLPRIKGGTEETTTGVNRLKAMAAAGELAFPMVAVNDADTKHLFDNRYGTGQSTIDGILRATNYLIAGTVFVVSGYGWCGRGIANRARGMGAGVIVTEVDPVKALEALMDGYRVMPISEAAKAGDIFVTATGGLHAIGRDHFSLMKDGAILANSGHFNVEIDLPALAGQSAPSREVRENVREYVTKDGKRIRVLAEGRLVNLSAAEGHPASVMDMSFANQALVVAWLTAGSKMAPGVYDVPKDIDHEVARRKLAAMGVFIDSLTKEQLDYARGFSRGT
jgi:adenosylhomocysteinase